ncbi:MAG: alpha/beta hydrolase [Bacillota bacterium]
METRELVLTNRDGKRMPATLQLPDGAPKGVALVLHGIGGWRSQPVLTHTADALQAEGYAVLRFDESDGITAPDNDFFHNTTTHYLRDVDDVIAFMHTQDWYRAPMILAGHSMGGLVAAKYASEHLNEVSKLILLAPAMSLRTMWWGQLPFALMWLIRGHWKMLGIDGRKFVLGPDWLKDFARYSGYKCAPLITAPTLIISAERDYTVAKPREHRLYARRFPNAEHSTITWADHDFDGHEAEVAATIRQWLTSS